MYDYIQGITYFFWTLSVYIIWAKEAHFEILYGSLSFLILKIWIWQFWKNKIKQQQQQQQQQKQQPNFKKCSYHLNME